MHKNVNEVGTCGEDIADTLLAFDRIQFTPTIQRSFRLRRGYGLFTWQYSF